MSQLGGLIAANAPAGDSTATNSKLDKIANLLVANTEQNKQYHSSADDRAIQQGRQTGKQFGRLATAF